MIYDGFTKIREFALPIPIYNGWSRLKALETFFCTIVRELYNRKQSLHSVYLTFTCVKDIFHH